MSNIIYRNIQKLFEYCCRPDLRWIWVCLSIVSLMGMADIPPVNNYKMPLPLWLKWSGVSLISLFKGASCIIIIALCHRRRLTRILSWMCIGIYSFLCVVNFVSLYFYEFGISRKMMSLIAQTNPEEAKEFMGTFIDRLTEIPWLGFFSAIIGIMIICFLVYKFPKKLYKTIFTFTFSAGFLSFLLLVMNVFQGKNSYSVLTRTGMVLIKGYQENRQLAELEGKMQPYSHPDKVNSNHDAFNIIVIYGESADKSHMSIYGYPLPTTPRMDAIADSLIVFNDVLASAPTTANNMERMLTMKHDDETDGWWNHSILIDILNAAGYRTYWLSNQERTGAWGNGTGVISSRADEVNYIGKASSEDPLLQKYDEALLPHIEKALADTIGPKWIGVHLMGSHFAYSNRYPEYRRHFTEKDASTINTNKWMNDHKYRIVSDYDNSILYTDSIIGEIMDKVTIQEKPSILIYISDHGENVYDDRDYNGRDKKHVKVPMIVYANSAYINNNPGIIDKLRNSTGKKITSANLPYAIMTLTGTHCPDYDETYDFLSDKYRERQRYVSDHPWEYGE